MRDYALGVKEIRDFIFLAAPSTTTINESNFVISEAALPNFQIMDQNIKKFLYDLFVLFRNTTRIPDVKCIEALQQYLINSDLLKRIMLTDKSPNVSYFRAIYEIPLHENTYKLAILSGEVNRVLTGILN